MLAHVGGEGSEAKAMLGFMLMLTMVTPWAACTSLEASFCNPQPNSFLLLKNLTLASLSNLVPSLEALQRTSHTPSVFCCGSRVCGGGLVSDY